MADIKAPAFQFYPKDFLSDLNVMAMSMTERGAYWTLVCCCWLEGSLPNDEARLARVVGMPDEEFAPVWRAVAPCFTVQDGRLVHLRLESERQKQEEFREAASNGGKTRARGGKRIKGRFAPADHQPATSLAGKDTPAVTSGSPALLSPISDLHTPSTRSKPSPSPDGDAVSDRFARFWAVYPKRKAKGDAEKAWKALHPSETLTDLIIVAVEAQTTWPEWRKDRGQFIPYPASWLRRKGWEDEPSAVVRPLGIAPVHTPWLCPHDPPCPHRAACEVVSDRKAS